MDSPTTPRFNHDQKSPSVAWEVPFARLTESLKYAAESTKERVTELAVRCDKAQRQAEIAQKAIYRILFGIAGGNFLFLLFAVPIVGYWVYSWVDEANRKVDQRISDAVDRVERLTKEELTRRTELAMKKFDWNSELNAVARRHLQEVVTPKTIEAVVKADDLSTAVSKAIGSDAFIDSEKIRALVKAEFKGGRFDEAEIRKVIQAELAKNGGFQPVLEQIVKSEHENVMKLAESKLKSMLSENSIQVSESDVRVILEKKLKDHPELLTQAVDRTITSEIDKRVAATLAESKLLEDGFRAVVARRKGDLMKAAVAMREIEIKNQDDLKAFLKNNVDKLDTESINKFTIIPYNNEPIRIEVKLRMYGNQYSPGISYWYSNVCSEHTKDNLKKFWNFKKLDSLHTSGSNAFNDRKECDSFIIDSVYKFLTAGLELGTPCKLRSEQVVD